MTKQQLEFLAKVTQPARDNQRAFRVPAAITIAQAIAESATSAGWGTSRLFRNANNPFGIKYAHRQGAEDYGHFDAATWEAEDGKKIETIAQFQRFPDLREAFAAHALLLLRPHYRPCMDALSDPAIPDPIAKIQKFAERLGPKTSANDSEHCGYSTNPDYSALLMKLIEEFRLDDERALEWYASGRDPAQMAVTDVEMLA